MHFMYYLASWTKTLLTSALCLSVILISADLSAAPKSKSEQAQAEALIKVQELSNEIQALKVNAITLNKDLRALEDELLFPANTQCKVYLSVKKGEFFKLENVKIKIDGLDVATHIYSDKQRMALEKGGMQRLYVGNLSHGKHKITAFFGGTDINNRSVKRAATLEFEKESGAKYIEVKMVDSPKELETKFSFKQW